MLLIEKVALLKATEIFSQIPDDILARLASVTEETTIEPHVRFIEKGDVGTDMYIIVEGRVRVHDASLVFTEVTAGMPIGEFALFSPAPRVASCTTEVETRLLIITRDALSDLMADRPEIADAVIRMLIERLRSANARISDLTAQLSQSTSANH